LNDVEDKISLAENPQFLRNLADCVNGARETVETIRGIMQQLPEVIDKVLPVARKGGLFLLSTYILYKSFLLYDEAKMLEENIRTYRVDFESLERAMKPYVNFIDTELIPQWETGNTSNLEKTVDKLLEDIGRPCEVLQGFIQVIRQDIQTGGSNQRWSTFCAVGSGAVCVGLFMAPPSYSVLRWVRVPVCVVTVGTVVYSWSSYVSLSDTLPKLERLEKDATTMREELTRYQSELHVAKMRSEL